MRSITTSVLVRAPSHGDAAAIAAIGSEAMPAQYADLVDAAAIDAAVSQTYSPAAVTACMDRCHEAPNASFLVAERSGQVAGFLHFDCFGPEPELHRLYVDRRHRAAGIGTQLMNALHAGLPKELEYVLLVVAGNEGAVRFYQRHGLEVAQVVDGLLYYSERMGVSFPRGTRPFSMVLMRRRPSR
jgi:ribosomal protein S18 acetylase RimI-like enzyme